MAAEAKGAQFDRVLSCTVLLLLMIGIVLIYSASVMESSRSLEADGQAYLKKQLIFAAISLAAGFVSALIPSTVWHKYSNHAVGLAILLLIAVLIAGKEVNEAKRWIALGPINLQPAEFLKLAWIMYLSSYAFKHGAEIRDTTKGFVKPLVFILLISLLLLFQPDFGSLVVITTITLGILFVAGAKLLKYILMMVAVGTACGVLILVQPYRLMRVVSFLDPWADEFGSGYQLTQSLMAFGRGGVTGEGLGNSIQKLGYLPEAHTDFVTAILGEEFGFIGMAVLIILEFVLVFRALVISFKILRRAPCFQGYAAFGVGMWFALQTVINIGAASGLLPTKGLTLPLVSYGGSALLVSMMAVGMLLRIDFEWRNKILRVE